MEKTPNIEQLKFENGTMKMATKVLAWGKRLAEENEKLKSEIERLKDEKFNWYERKNLLPLPDDTPDEKKIKTLTWRLWKSKESYKQLRDQSNAEIKRLNDVIDELRTKITNVLSDPKRFYNFNIGYDDVVDFDSKVIQFFIDGLTHYKNSSICLLASVPGDIRSKYNWNCTGEEENRMKEEWAKIINKMIKAWSLLKDSIEHTRINDEEAEKQIEEGINLFCKYVRCFWV